MPRAAAFWTLAGLFLMVFFASAAASPLYRVYQAQFRFSAATLTAVFAVYVLVLLATLLVFGSVSDYLGRLPVIVTALVFSVAGCAVFLAAHDVGARYAARSLQGIATGLASGPIGAALIDLQPPGSQRAPLVTSVFSSLGLALGALITSALVQYAPAPDRLIWWALLVVFAAGLLAVPAMAEPGSRRPGALASLRPRVAVPRPVRGTFAAAVPCIVSGWALGGLYLSLGPSLAAQATNSPNLLWGGLVIFLICGTGAAAAFALRGIGSRATMLTGCLFLLAGMAITFGAIATTTAAAFLAGTTVAGVGFGLAFLGSFRMITALAEPDDRAGLVTAVYIVGYLAFSVPALAGLLGTELIRLPSGSGAGLVPEPAERLGGGHRDEAGCPRLGGSPPVVQRQDAADLSGAQPVPAVSARRRSCCPPNEDIPVPRRPATRNHFVFRQRLRAHTYAARRARQEMITGADAQARSFQRFSYRTGPGACYAARGSLGSEALVFGRIEAGTRSELDGDL